MVTLFTPLTASLPNTMPSPFSAVMLVTWTCEVAICGRPTCLRVCRVDRQSGLDRDVVVADADIEIGEHDVGRADNIDAVGVRRADRVR